MGRKAKSAYDRTEFIRMSDEHTAFELADKLLRRNPLIINFEDYNVVESNRVIVFLSGVIYALDGEVELIKEKVMAFATKQDFRDKSLRDFIKKHKET